MMRLFIAGILCVMAGATPAAAADEVSFAGKTITMTIGHGAGGGVDLYGRLLGQTLVRYLPGNPNLVVVNQTGAGGVVALNEWVVRSKPDGLSVTIGAASQSDPDALFRTNAKFDPRKFEFVGGVGAPSQGLFASKDAVPRLRDKSKEPVVMGMVGTTLRTGNYQALWGGAFLGWNLRWVPGYKQTSEIRQAMERGELDMASLGSIRDIEYMQNTGKFVVVSQSGTTINGKLEPREELGNAPIMSNLLEGKIKDPKALEAFEYSENVLQLGKWLALPPGTPEPIVATYVKAFDATLKDPTFQEQIKKVDPDSPVVSRADLQKVMRDLAKVSPETLTFITAELERQGMQVK